MVRQICTQIIDCDTVAGLTERRRQRIDCDSPVITLTQAGIAINLQTTPVRSLTGNPYIGRHPTGNHCQRRFIDSCLGQINSIRLNMSGIAHISSRNRRLTSQPASQYAGPHVLHKDMLILVAHFGRNILDRDSLNRPLLHLRTAIHFRVRQRSLDSRLKGQCPLGRNILQNLRRIE